LKPSEGIRSTQIAGLIILLETFNEDTDEIYLI
jgi:hypothetical protein